MKAGTSMRMFAWAIALTLVALPVVGVLQGWFAADRWPVRELEVRASFRHVSARQIRAAVEPSLGTGFFAIRLDAVRDAVATLPWVARVEVSKRWPDALEITVTEIQPVAHWGADALLGRDGRIFRVPDGASVRGLPRFNGPDDRAADVLAFYHAATTDFSPYGLRVGVVDLSASGSWSLVLANGARVVVGVERPELRLARFTATLPVVMRGRSAGFEYADLRYSNGFAVRWPEAAAPAIPPNPTKGASHVADGNV